MAKTSEAQSIANNWDAYAVHIVPFYRSDKNFCFYSCHVCCDPKIHFRLVVSNVCLAITNNVELHCSVLWNKLYQGLTHVMSYSFAHLGTVFNRRSRIRWLSAWSFGSVGRKRDVVLSRRWYCKSYSCLCCWSGLTSVRARQWILLKVWCWREILDSLLFLLTPLLFCFLLVCGIQVVLQKSLLLLFCLQALFFWLYYIVRPMSLIICWLNIKNCRQCHCCNVRYAPFDDGVDTGTGLKAELWLVEFVFLFDGHGNCGFYNF